MDEANKAMERFKKTLHDKKPPEPVTVQESTPKLSTKEYVPWTYILLAIFR